MNVSESMPVDTQQQHVLAAACLHTLAHMPERVQRVRQKGCLPEPSEAIAKRRLYQLLQPYKEGADDELRAGYSSTSHLMRVTVYQQDWQTVIMAAGSAPRPSSHCSADPIQTTVCVQRWQCVLTVMALQPFMAQLCMHITTWPCCQYLTIIPSIV